MLFGDGETKAIPVERDGWHHSLIDCTGHLIEVLRQGGRPSLDGEAGKAVLQFALAAHQSAKTGQVIQPDQVGLP